MRKLLFDIVALIQSNLTYFSWVGVIEDEQLPPKGPPPPFCGIKDGGIIPRPIPDSQDLEQLTVIVIPYQYFSEPGAATLGSVELGDRGKGLIDISDDLNNLLKNEYFNHCFHYARLEQLEPVATIIEPETLDLLYLKRNIFRWRRYK